MAGEGANGFPATVAGTAVRCICGSTAERGPIVQCGVRRPALLVWGSQVSYVPLNRVLQKMYCLFTARYSAQTGPQLRIARP